VQFFVCFQSFFPEAKPSTSGLLYAAVIFLQFLWVIFWLFSVPLRVYELLWTIKQCPKQKIKK